MSGHRIFKTKFADVYPLYVQKAERKQRSKDEVDQAIRWLTGYSQTQLQRQIDAGIDFEAFFDHAPAGDTRTSRVEGTVCGVRVEDVEHPLMRKIRSLDKLIDELAKGKPIPEIPR